MLAELVSNYKVRLLKTVPSLVVNRGQLSPAGDCASPALNQADLTCKWTSAGLNQASLAIWYNPSRGLLTLSVMFMANFESLFVHLQGQKR